ncbi:hypothetical protein Ddc_24632 [Ditylenchus destructor]|nr:hypothetical protein Ddc_24632 [Ditylenchus destructor]
MASSATAQARETKMDMEVAGASVCAFMAEGPSIAPAASRPAVRLWRLGPVEQNALLGLGVRDHAGNPADQATHHQPDEEVHGIALEKKLRLVVKGNRRARLLQAVQSLGLSGAVSWSEAGRISARSASWPEGVWASRPRSGDSLTWGRSVACSINSSMMKAAIELGALGAGGLQGIGGRACGLVVVHPPPASGSRVRQGLVGLDQVFIDLGQHFPVGIALDVLGGQVQRLQRGHAVVGLRSCGKRDHHVAHGLEDTVGAGRRESMGLSLVARRCKQMASSVPARLGVSRARRPSRPFCRPHSPCRLYRVLMLMPSTAAVRSFWYLHGLSVAG